MSLGQGDVEVFPERQRNQAPISSFIALGFFTGCVPREPFEQDEWGAGWVVMASLASEDVRHEGYLGASAQHDHGIDFGLQLEGGVESRR